MIARDICQRVLRKAVSTGADYAEIFAENTVNHNINMIASRVDSIKDTVIAGAAVRVYKGMRSVMASTVDTSEEGLLMHPDSFNKAQAAMAKKQLSDSLITLSPLFAHKPYFMADEFGWCDVLLAPLLWRLEEMGIELPRAISRPLFDYQKRVFERDSFQKSVR